jgi:hypothetical protein
MLLNIGKRLPSVQNGSAVINTPGSLNSPVVYTLGSLSSPVVNTLRNLEFPVMNTTVSRFLGVLWTSPRTGLQKTFWWQTVRESRLPNVFITGESCLPDVFYPVFVIPQNKVLIPCDSEYFGRVHSETRNETERNSTKQWSFTKQLTKVVFS